MRGQSLQGLAPCVFRRRRKAFADALGRPVLVFGHGSALGAGSASHGNLRFLTGWDSHESASLLILRPNGDAKLLLTSPFMQPLAQERVPELAPRHLPLSDWPAAIRALIPQGEAGLIGMAELPFAMAQTLTGLIRPDPMATADLNRLRLIKDDTALDLHRRGAAICDAMFARLPDVLHPGAAVLPVQRALESFALAQGADYCRTWLTVRPAADRPRYWPSEAEGVANPGDQVLIGIALTVDGHWAHGIRMGSIGPMRSDHRQLFDIVSRCLDGGLALARPGVALADLAAAMDKAFAAGTPDLDMRMIQRFRFGHGLGMSYEDPILTDAFVQYFGTESPPAMAESAGGILAPGMVLELHPNLFLPGLGGAALGEMVIVTDAAPECPIRISRDPFLI
jgi:Xaa-Pro aminopeptidase